MRKRWLLHTSCCAMLVTSIVEARAVTDARPRVLPEAEERDLALEALPPLLREDAGVWVMTREGYRELRRTKNGIRASSTGTRSTQSSRRAMTRRGQPRSCP